MALDRTGPPGRRDSFDLRPRPCVTARFVMDVTRHRVTRVRIDHENPHCVPPLLNAATSRASASAEIREPSTSTDLIPSTSSNAGLTVEAVVSGRRGQPVHIPV